MAKLINDRLIRALLRQPVDCTPVWIMRQAGRYLPEYRAVRQKAGDFLTLCKTPELACEVTLQPLHRFDLDAAIIFSDILTIPDAMGLGLHFVEGEGPRFQQTLNSYQQILDLPVPDPEQQLRYVMDAIRLTKQELHSTVPLIGFAGSPWTLAAYMLEGGSSKQFTAARALTYREPQWLHALLTRLTQATILYLNAQIQAGVDVVMLFDTWGGLLTSANYREFSLQYMQQIVTELQRQQTDRYVPAIIFTKGGGLWLEAIAQSGCEAVGLDWTVDIDQARKRVGDEVALQGNLDPAVLYSSPAAIKNAVTDLLTRYGSSSGHVFNLGHGIEPDVPPEHVQVLVDTVHSASRRSS